MKWKQFRASLESCKTLLIVVQDYPDPDALASACALKELAHSLADIACSIASGGSAGRSENRAMIHYLDVNLLPIQTLDLSRYDAIAMVDTQPATGNNTLPPERLPDIVIDHHPLRPMTRRVTCRDIRRRYGATATILTEYLREAGMTPGTPLATALLYGIRSDTQDLGRESTKADFDAYLYLYPMANKRMLREITNGSVPRAYFRMMAEALAAARIVGRTVIAGLASVENGDSLSEIADWLLRYEDADWSLVHAFCGDRFLFSIRTSDLQANAGKVAHRIAAGLGSGGGHSAMAGGRCDLAGDAGEMARRHLVESVTRRFLRATGVPAGARMELLSQ